MTIPPPGRIACPFCGDCDSFVADSRGTESHQYIRRRRKCTACNSTFTTYETIEKPTESSPILLAKLETKLNEVLVIIGALKS